MQISDSCLTLILNLDDSRNFNMFPNNLHFWNILLHDALILNLVWLMFI